jgi:hypothetical protein
MSQQLSQQVMQLKQREEQLQLRNTDLLRTLREHNIYYEEG